LPVIGIKAFLTYGNIIFVMVCPCHTDVNPDTLSLGLDIKKPESTDIEVMGVLGEKSQLLDFATMGTQLISIQYFQK
tara:strand:+ start:200 stop:430 length:231 start_codon:yes stop_codon:yes gene_type:complete